MKCREYPHMGCDFVVGQMRRSGNCFPKVLVSILSTFLLSLFLFLLPLYSIGQIGAGIPFIHNFTPKQYAAGSQNRCIVQNNRGLMYVANSNGVLEYDGETWRVIPMPNKSEVISLAVDTGGLVYVGGVDELGFLSANAVGQTSYVSLTSQLNLLSEHFGEVRNIHVLNGHVYYETERQLMDYFEGKLHVISPQKTNFTATFLVNDQLYASEQHIGLLRLSGDSLRLLSGSEQFIGKGISEVLPFATSQDLLMVTEKHGLWYYDWQQQTFEQVTERFPDLQSYQSKEPILKAHVLPNGNWAFVPKTPTGSAVFSPNGRLISRLTQQMGLNDNMLLDHYATKNGDFWIGMDNGLSYVEMSSPWTHFDERNGINGSVYAVIKQDSLLLVGTSSGIYYWDRYSFRRIDGVNEPVSQFLNFSVPSPIENPTQPRDNKLLASTDGGLYEIRGLKAKLLSDIKQVAILAPYQKDPNVLLVGHLKGIGALRLKDGVWMDEGNLREIDQEVTHIGQDGTEDFWLGTRSDGVIRVDVGTYYKHLFKFKDWDYKVTRYDTLAGLPTLNDISIYRIQGKIRFATDQGLFAFVKSQEKFVPDPLLGKRFMRQGKGMTAMTQSASGEFIAQLTDGQRQWVELAVQESDTTWEWDAMPFKRLPDLSIASEHSLFFDDSLIWIGSSEGLFRYDRRIAANSDVPFPVLIRKVTLGSDSVIYWGNLPTDSTESEKLQPSIDYSKNILFEFAVPYFEAGGENNYSFYLEGFDQEWSAWEQHTEKEYTNLDAGNYIFHVKAKNVYGKESKAATYEFSILQPWYLSTWSYVGYLLGLGLLVWMIVKIYIGRLKAANVRLERIIAHRTAEIQGQHEEILAQAEQLRKQNVELEQLSIVAQQTENAVFIFSEGFDLVWAN